MLSCFDAVVFLLKDSLQPYESFSLWFEAERSQFVRLNRGRIRQAIYVEQAYIQLQLMSQGRVVTGRLALQRNQTENENHLHSWLKQQRENLNLLPPDPHLIVPETVHSSEYIEQNSLPDAADALQDVLTQACGVDLVGLYASGPIYRGFANSSGQRNVMQRNSYNLDCSLYSTTNQAVKLHSAGSQWDSQIIKHHLQSSQQQLQELQRPCKQIKPGIYRAYLAPAAVREILTTLASWGAFSLQAYNIKSSPLQNMQLNQTCLHQSISLQENTADGFSPSFQQQGFIRPNCVHLIERGALRSHLISPRSAQQYRIACNAANSAEIPESLEMAPGRLKEQEILSQLDTGLYVGNLWYINPSDLSQGRLTGMTRFFTCWVQNGQLQGPVEPMRFDDTIYHLFGKHVETLTQQRELFLDSSTYDQRSTQSMRLPGILLSQLRLTL